MEAPNHRDNTKEEGNSIVHMRKREGEGVLLKILNERHFHHFT